MTSANAAPEVRDDILEGIVRDHLPGNGLDSGDASFVANTFRGDFFSLVLRWQLDRLQRARGVLGPATEAEVPRIEIATGHIDEKTPLNKALMCYARELSSADRAALAPRLIRAIRARVAVLERENGARGGISSAGTPRLDPASVDVRITATELDVSRWRTLRNTLLRSLITEQARLSARMLAYADPVVQELSELNVLEHMLSTKRWNVDFPAFLRAVLRPEELSKIAK